jgi:hypothetical protein
MAEHDFVLHLFPLFDEQNASIEMTSDAIVTTATTISFDDGDSTTLDAKTVVSKLKDVYCYREGGGMYQDDYERLLQCQAETVRMTPSSMLAATIHIRQCIIDLSLTTRSLQEK